MRKVATSAPQLPSTVFPVLAAPPTSQRFIEVTLWHPGVSLLREHGGAERRDDQPGVAPLPRRVPWRLRRAVCNGLKMSAERTRPMTRGHYYETDFALTAL